MKAQFILIFSFIALLILLSCAPKLSDRDSDGMLLPEKIGKFQDGNVVCWVYLNHGISCVKK